MKHNIREIDIEYKCPKCKHINKPTEKSNENWKVINTTCDNCGEKCNFRILKNNDTPLTNLSGDNQ